MATPDRVAELRQLLIDSIKRLPPGCAISLSGGLDTSIIAEANISCPTPDLASQEPVSHAPITHAVTVLTSAMATDRPHSIGIAKRLNLQHTVIEYDTPLDLVRDTSLLEFTVRTLGSFDPMEIRNSAAVARALMECKKLGLENVATGDGADELFAGYSFLHKLDPQALKNYLVRMAKVMRFSAVPMSEALGLKVWQPYLDAKVLEFALTCTKDELIQPQPGSPDLVTGKYILRQAFPEASSCWRKKDPIEVGSGTTALPELAKTLFPSESEFEQEKARILEEDRIKIRDQEHLIYYRIFRPHFITSPDPVTTSGRLLVRHGTDPCRSCGFQLQQPEQTFCVVCGEWPAREVPASAPEEEKK